MSTFGKKVKISKYFKRSNYSDTMLKQEAWSTTERRPQRKTWNSVNDKTIIINEYLVLSRDKPDRPKQLSHVIVIENSRVSQAS